MTSDEPDDRDLRIARAAKWLEPHIKEDRPGVTTAVRAAYGALQPTDAALKTVEAGAYYRGLWEAAQKKIHQLESERRTEE